LCHGSLELPHGFPGRSAGDYHVIGAVRDLEKMNIVAELEGFDMDRFTPMSHGDDPVVPMLENRRTMENQSHRIHGTGKKLPT